MLRESCWYWCNSFFFSFSSPEHLRLCNFEGLSQYLLCEGIAPHLLSLMCSYVKELLPASFSCRRSKEKLFLWSNFPSCSFFFCTVGNGITTKLVDFFYSRLIQAPFNWLFLYILFSSSTDSPFVNRLCLLKKCCPSFIILVLTDILHNNSRPLSLCSQWLFQQNI